MLKIKKVLLLFFLPFIVSCNGFFEKDNEPQPKSLITFHPTIHTQLLWSVNTKAGSSAAYLKLDPIVDDTAIFTVSSKGIVTATNSLNGQTRWQINTRLPVSAGLGYEYPIIILASSKGNILALEASNGKIRWQTQVAGEVLASPVVQQGLVIIKTTHGQVTALSTDHGKIRWVFKQTEPNFILRRASKPLILNNNVIVGFANGSLAKLNLYTGQLVWQQKITIPEGAFTIQRMIDIDVDPIVFDHHIYVATYQGNLAALDWTLASKLWSHSISSYTGMVIDDSSLYLSDASSYVWSFNTNNGLVNWQQRDLQWRKLTAPALMHQYIIVGDAEGYLHWLHPKDGHLVAREFAGASIYATPIVHNGIAYVLTSNGYLLAYKLR